MTENRFKTKNNQNWLKMAKIVNDVYKKKMKRKILCSPNVQILDILIVKFCQILKERIFSVLVNLF